MGMARSAPGSTSGGAAERSEAEGMYYDEWYKRSLRTNPSASRSFGTVITI